MIDALGFSQGMRQNDEYRNRQRREIAMAFENFKQQNPHASYADFQSFIDGQVGTGAGSNYLRGGVPGQDVLRSLERDNMTRKAQDEFQRRAQQVIQQEQLLGTVQGMADRHIFENFDDLDKAYGDFSNLIGPDIVDALGPTMNIRGLFSPQRAETMKRQEVERLIPLALNFIEASNGQIDINDLGSRLGVSMSIMNPVMEAAKKQYEQRETQRKEQEAQDAMLRRGQIETALGTDPALNTLIERGGDPARAHRHMLNIVRNNMTDAQFMNAYGMSKAEAENNTDIFKDFYEARVGLLRENQHLQYEDKNRTAMQAADQMVSQFINQNIETAQEYFSRQNGEAAVGGSSLQGSYAAVSLAREYQMTPTIINQISMLLRDLPEELQGDSTRIKHYIQTHPDFQAVAEGRELNNVTEQMRQSAVRSVVGREGGIQPFSSFRESEIASFDEYKREFEARINRAIAIPDPAQSERELARLTQLLERDMALQNQELRYAQQNRSFIEAGPDAWNDELVFGNNPESIEAQMNSMSQGLKAKLDQYANEKMSQARAMSTRQPVVPQSSVTGSQTRSTFSSAINNMSANSQASNAIEQAAGFGITPLQGYFRTPEAEWNRVSQMKDYVKDEYVMSRLSEFYNSSSEADRSVMLDDLKSLSVEQFKAKYGDLVSPR